MKRLFKWLIALVVVVIVLVVAALGVTWWYLDSIARKGVEVGGTYALGVPTTLKSASVQILRGKVVLEGLQVANPGGYETPFFLSLDKSQGSATFSELRGKPAVIQRLEFTGLKVNLEKKKGQSNYQVILDNLAKLDSGEKAKTQQGTQEKAYIIKEVVVTNVQAHVDLVPLAGGLTQLDVTIPEIKLTDVGKKSNGAQMSELYGVLMKAIFNAIVQKGGNGLKEIGGDLTKGLSGLKSLGADGIGGTMDLGKGVVDLGGNVLGKAGDVGGKALEGVGKGLGGATKGLGGLLNQNNNNNNNNNNGN